MTLPPPSFVAPARPPVHPHKKPSVRQIAEWSRHDARSAVVGMFAVGLTVDLATHSHLIGAAGVIAVAVACVALLRSGRVSAKGRGALLLAVGLTPWLLLRMSPWLITLNALTMAGLLLLAVTRSRRLTSVFTGVGATPGTTASIARSAVPEASRSKGKAYGRAVLVAVPLGGAMLLILASGDRFFASWLGLSAVGERIADAIWVAVIGIAWLVFVTTSQQTVEPKRVVRSSKHRDVKVEAKLTLTTVAVVLVGYVASLVVAALAGRAYVERRAGLTYANYARSGFFQLVTVVMIIVATLLYFRPAITNGGGRLRLLTVVTATGTIAMAAVAVVRLQTYRSIFGLTMLRFGTTVFATWLGVVVFLVAVALAQPRLYRHLGVAALLSAYAAVAYGNWANPEAMIARENIARIDWTTGTTRSPTGAEFDVNYLSSLSDDAVPALVIRLETLPPEQAAALTDRLCNVPQRLDGGWSWNRSRAEAYEARRVLCHWQ
jgi:Domain of unknown function (DUF4173)